MPISTVLVQLEAVAMAFNSHSHQICQSSWSSENVQIQFLNTTEEFYRGSQVCSSDIIQRANPQFLNDAVRYNSCGPCKVSLTVVTWVLESLVNDPCGFSLLMQCFECTILKICLQNERPAQDSTSACNLSLSESLLSIHIFFFTLNRKLSVVTVPFWKLFAFFLLFVVFPLIYVNWYCLSHQKEQQLLSYPKASCKRFYQSEEFLVFIA